MGSGRGLTLKLCRGSFFAPVAVLSSSLANYALLNIARAILAEARFNACLQLPFWTDMWHAAVAAVSGEHASDWNNSTAGTPEPVAFAPSPLILFAAQLENKCWRRALHLQTAASPAVPPAMQEVALALLVQCPGGEAHEARRLLDLSPLGREEAPAEGPGQPRESRSSRARFSLKALLVKGPLTQVNVDRDRDARTAARPSTRASCFLPLSRGSGQDALPLSPMCVYAPLKTLYEVAELSKVGVRGFLGSAGVLGRRSGIRVLTRRGDLAMPCSCVFSHGSMAACRSTLSRLFPQTPLFLRTSRTWSSSRRTLIFSHEMLRRPSFCWPKRTRRTRDSCSPWTSARASASFTTFSSSEARCTPTTVWPR